VACASLKYSANHYSTAAGPVLLCWRRGLRALRQWHNSRGIRFLAKRQLADIIRRHSACSRSNDRHRIPVFTQANETIFMGAANGVTTGPPWKDGEARDTFATRRANHRRSLLRRSGRAAAHQEPKPNSARPKSPPAALFYASANQCVDLPKMRSCPWPISVSALISHPCIEPKGSELRALNTKVPNQHPHMPPSAPAHHPRSIPLSR
jgi:hypothetical protein